ncbi:MAG TPA: ABC transporter permease [Bryobacteraceae bacterium]|jgi:putative ABC transport system permease protein|nr:ABC transporter permease [Bryobacteraceae bacterium]
MPLPAHLSSLFRNLFRKSGKERELNDEVHAYVRELTGEKVRSGMHYEEARRAAAIELGGVEQVKEAVRDVRRGHMLEQLLQDIRYAARALRKNPGFTAVAMLALALGVGANTAMFSVVYGILLRPLPYPDADRIAVVYMHWLPWDNPRANMSMADFLDWKSQTTSFEESSLYASVGRRFDLTGAGDPEQVSGASATSGFFGVLRARPIVGRTFLAGDDQPASARVAVIGASLWQRRFAGRADALGQPIILNGVPCTVVGVMPESFHFPLANSEVWTNLPVVPPKRRGPFFYRAFGRLKPGVTLQQAQAEANAIGRRIEQANPTVYSHLDLPVISMRDAMVGDIGTPLIVMLCAVCLVLLIAVVNVANLMLARATVREREMALRLSLGAGRGRLVRQLLTESVLLSGLGGIGGLALAYLGIVFLRAANPGNLPRITDIHVDGTVLAFLLLISLLTGILFGLAPALQSARADLSSTLKEGGRGTTGGLRQRTRSVLIVSEIALSLMLLVGAGLLLRSLLRLQRVDAGFHGAPEHILAMTVSPANRRYADEATGIAFYGRLLDRVRQLPGIRYASLSDGLPPDQEGDADTFVIQDAAPRTSGNPVVTVDTVSPDYFRTMGIGLVRGRAFEARDGRESVPVAMVSESFARRFLPGEDPLGKRIKESGPELTFLPFREIVGVVADVKYTGLDANRQAAYYLPYTQNYTRRTFLVVNSSSDSAGDAANLAPMLRREIQAVDKDVVVAWVSTLQQAMRDSVARPRFDAILLMLFAGVALLLAVIGIYGVIAYAVAQRTHEIGVRMALGACRADVLHLVLRQGARLAAMGIAVGLGGAFMFTRLMRTLLFDTSVQDTFTFAAAAVGLFAVALLASIIPAHRATRIDPLSALRN